MFFELKISEVSGEWGIVCEKLGIVGQSDTMEGAMDSFKAAIDLLAGDQLAKCNKDIFIDIERQRFSFKNTVEMLPLIFELLKRRSGKSFTDLQKDLGLASTGAVHKYFSKTNKTIPNTEKFFDLMQALNAEIKIG